MENKTEERNASLKITEDLWEALNKEKRMGETFEQVIWRLTKLKKEEKKSGK